MKNMTMHEDIKKAITNNLPQALGEELRKRLERADVDSEEVKRLTRVNQKIEAQNAELEAKLSIAKERVSELESREESVANREKAITTLELTAKFEIEKRELVQSMFGTVFANRVTRENVLTMRGATTRTEEANAQNNWQTTKTTTDPTADSVDTTITHE